MANKKSLLGGMTIKVENMSGFDKSGFHGFTAPLGAIVPMRKQLCIPGNGNIRVKISAQLPPLASDAFLRSHLKVEAFAVPLRLCYGGFQSWFSGEQVVSVDNRSGDSESVLTRAKLPRLHMNRTDSDGRLGADYLTNYALDGVFGPQTLMDYFGVKMPLSLVDDSVDSGDGDDAPAAKSSRSESGVHVSKVDVWNFLGDAGEDFNIFPFIAYQLCYHHWYRNKLVERPLFAPPTSDSDAAWTLPFIARDSISDYTVDLTVSSLGYGYETEIERREAFFYIPDYIYSGSEFGKNAELLNGHLLELRQRNYGYDYFTTALPSAQEGNPISVDTSGGSFTISALRIQNSMQHFSEINQFASPDYVQVNKARYGVDISEGVAQKPILLGSADFPMFTSGVEQTAGSEQETNNPFGGMAARYGRAHAEGSDFVCEFHCNEPSYIMIMASLVPEANYATGCAHDMKIFTKEGSLVDLPVASLENTGMEPVYAYEVEASRISGSRVFGYQPRFMWHKAGQMNMISGLFRAGASLQSFIPQRVFNEPLAPDESGHADPVELSTAFLKVLPWDLDGVTAVEGAISEYGVMIDSAVDFFVSEPLGESVLPSLVDPAYEHGKSVYLRRGGSGV